MSFFNNVVCFFRVQRLFHVRVLYFVEAFRGVGNSTDIARLFYCGNFKMIDCSNIIILFEYNSRTIRNNCLCSNFK